MPSPSMPRPTSSTPSAPRSASAAARWPACTPPTWPRTRSRRLVDRTGIDPGAVDDVILGCCDTIGSQAGDVARTAWLVAGLPDHVPGVTIDRQCGSSPAGGALRRPGRHVRHPGPGRRRRRAEHERHPDLRGDAGRPAVRLLDAVRRVARLAGAVRRPGGQPVPLRRDDRREVGHLPRGHGGVRAGLARPGPHARSPRAGSTARSSRSAADGTASTPTSARGRPRWRRWPALQPLAPGGRITAAVASQICDASSAMLIASEQAVARPRTHPARPGPPPLGHAATTRSGCSPGRSAPPSALWRRPG